MKKLNFWKKYLIVISFIIMILGFYVAILNNTGLFNLFNRFIDPVFWPDNNITENIISFKGFVYSLLGATIIVWGVFIHFISKHAFETQKKWVWNCLFITTLVWFLIDEFFSVYYRVYYNALFNLIFLLLIIIPLIFTKKYFTE